MSTDILKLYHASGSPNSRRVRMYLAERNLSVSMVSVDLSAKEQFSPAYIEINPRSMVPTLVLANGTSIGEVPAIWRYLEESFAELPLLGSTPEEKSLITMWERRVELDGFAAVMEGVRNTVTGLKGRALAGPHAYEQIPALAERSAARVLNFFDDLEARLANSQFVAGDKFSVADITALVTLDFATGGMNLPVPKTHLAVKKWYATVSARPSAKA